MNENIKNVAQLIYRYTREIYIALEDGGRCKINCIITQPTFVLIIPARYQD